MPSDSATLPPAGDDLAAVALACEQFFARCGSVMLATVSAAGEPHVSYAPVVADARHQLYLLLSDLAAHSANLRRHGAGEVMMIEGEGEARNPFARQRLTLRCRVAELARGSEPYRQRLAQLRQAHGETVALLATLADFRLLCLTPASGRFVRGFGRAYGVSRVDGALVVEGPVVPAR